MYSVILRYSRLPSSAQRSFSRLLDFVTNRTRGAYTLLQPGSENSELIDGDDDIEEEYNDDVLRDSNQSHEGGDGLGSEAGLMGDIYDPEYEEGLEGFTRRSSFASVYEHPLTSEPVMGMSGIILSWLAFIAFQWFLRDTVVGTSDNTVVPPLLRRHHWGYVESPTVISRSISTSTSTSTSTMVMAMIRLIPLTLVKSSMTTLKCTIVTLWRQHHTLPWALCPLRWLFVLRYLWLQLA